MGNYLQSLHPTPKLIFVVVVVCETSSLLCILCWPETHYVDKLASNF
jgi:S-adenosylmethionine/arginine decarboxylase-like enzyme